MDPIVPPPTTSADPFPAPVPPRPTPSRSSGFVMGLLVGLGLFLLLGFMGGVVGYSAVAKAKTDARKGWNLVPVVVAAKDISENSTVTMEMISQRAVPEQFVTSSVVRPDSASYIVGQKVLVAVQAGDYLLWTQFETTKASERLSKQLANDDTRITTIKVSPESGVGGWVRPGDLVDVIAVYPAPDTREPTVTTILENVRVLATGRITGATNVNLVPESERRYGEVSLVVTADQAERLALLASSGTLTLSLRRENNGPAREGKVRRSLKAVLAP